MHLTRGVRGPEPTMASLLSGVKTSLTDRKTHHQEP